MPAFSTCHFSATETSSLLSTSRNKHTESTLQVALA